LPIHNYFAGVEGLISSDLEPVPIDLTAKRVEQETLYGFKIYQSYKIIILTLFVLKFN
jgi:hypothetical protein